MMIILMVVVMMVVVIFGVLAYVRLCACLVSVCVSCVVTGAD
jgi:hypothetical protein